MHSHIHFVCTHAIKHKETSKTSVALVGEGKTFRRLVSVVFRVKYKQKVISDNPIAYAEVNGVSAAVRFFSS